MAAVNADVSSDELASKLQPLWYGVLGAVLLSGILALSGATYLSARVGRPLRDLTRAMTQIQKGDLNTVVATQGKDEFSALGQALNAMTAGLRERETVKKAFSHYVSRRVIDAVVDSGNLPSLQGVRRRITVLFCDIRGFTSMSEKMSPEAVVQFLNNHFETVVEIVDRNHGLVDKYIGDGIMVLFGAQDEDAYQEGHAVRTALQIRDELARRSRQLAKDGLPPVAVGIGINSGSAIVGNIGASQRLEYTAIGATVNLASRLETATRELDVDILISEYTQQEVRGKFTLNKIGAVRLGSTQGQRRTRNDLYDPAGRPR